MTSNACTLRSKNAATAKIRLYRPDDLFGKAICWRLESDFSHATIEIEGRIYSATAPNVEALDPDNPEVSLKTRQGICIDLPISVAQQNTMRAWCATSVGRGYDILSIVGWLFRIRALQTRGRYYCFEYVRAALAQAGIIGCSTNFISGDELLSALLVRGGVIS